MRSILLTILMLSLHFVLEAQALRDINYRYLYNPDEPFIFRIHPVRTPQGWLTHYKLLLRDSLDNPKEYSIQWEIREALSDKVGKVLAIDSSSVHISKHTLVGQVALTQS